MTRTKKKEQKLPKDPRSKKNRKKSRFGPRAPRPHGLPKRALGLTFGP